MKQILIICLIAIGINAKIINVKQLFNKQIIKVKEQTQNISKSFYGYIVLDESKINDVTLRFDGFINELKANEEHKYIKNGDKLFSIYSKEVVSNFEELLISKQYNRKANIKNIKRKLMLLDIDKKTINNILKTNKIPYYIDINSKYNGIIINKKINNGSFIKRGFRVFQIADISTLWANIQVYQKDIGFVKVGDGVKIIIDGFKTIDAKIDYIHPFMNEKTKTIIVRAIIPNKDLKLYPNLFIKAVVFKNQKTMLILPNTAVITKADKYYVFKPINDREFEVVEVKAKRISATRFQILSGVNKNDEVINNALFLLDSDALTNGLYDSDDDDW